MKKFFFILAIIASCKQNQNSYKNKTIIDSHDSLASTLVGKWGEKSGVPVWEITKDSLYYFGEKKSYYYLIHDKNMIVLYKEDPFILNNIRTVEDTLIFSINGGGIIESYRVR